MISPVTGDAAYSNDPATWTVFEDALLYMESFRMEGIALALTGGIEFIDLDHSVDKETGIVVKETAKNILAELPDTYAELSTSGTGVHIFCFGKHPDGMKNRNDNLGVEMYDHGRFACFTGKVFENRNVLLDYSDKIGDLAFRYVGVRPPKLERRSCQTVSADDGALIDKILRSRQAVKFQNLYSGAMSGYDNHSQADSALVWLLAFWTRDREQIDRIFRSSGLYRDKWDRNLYDTTYGEDMINTALEHVRPHRELEAY